jgi:hypothetical protein
MPFAEREKENAYRRKRYKMPKVKAQYDRYRKSVNGKAAHARAEKKYAQKIKLQVIKHYCGGSKIKCQCPGCRTVAVCFLQIDHVDGKGHSHKIGGHPSVGKSLWRWLIRNNFPPGFQVLCSNCNSAKRCSASCPMSGERH